MSGMRRCKLMRTTRRGGENFCYFGYIEENYRNF
jgi:hypothetical protein